MKKIIWAGAMLTVLLAEAAQAQGKPTPEELSRFFDRAVPALMEEFRVAGAVVGVANSSEVLFLRGYGSADLEAGKSVNPEATLFRAGSISKLFTWTAIMQLEEQGRLDLDDPVEKHLDFALPDTFEQPVRVIDLMNHTPGFADRLIGLFAQEEKYLVSLHQAVSRNIPRRVRPPATEVSYSNYGTMLAGYIVERLSGMPYEEYVEKHILEPLGMERSTFRQPLPPQLAGHLATGYSYRGGQHVPEKFEIVIGAPAGALSTTAGDMLRFYQAYLNGGQLHGVRILREETVGRMQQPTFRHDPRAGGFAHGFFQSGSEDLQAFGHGGDTIFFHSDSAYLPGRDLAYFVSTNTSTGMRLTVKLQELLLDEFFPAPAGSELAARAGLDPDLREYTGFFAMNRRSESDPTQLMGTLTLARPKIAAGGEGLWIASILEPKGGVYVPVDRDIFQQKEGRRRFVFLRDERGEVRSLYSNEFPAFLFSRPPWIESPLLSLVIVAAGLLLLLSALLAPPTGLLTLIPRLRPRSGGAGRLLALWSGRAFIALILAEIILINSLGNFIFVPIGPAQAIPLYLAAAVVAAVLVSAVLTWRNRLFRLAGRLHYSAFALAQAFFITWLGYWGFFFV